MSDRLGFLSATGAVVAAIVVVVLLAWTFIKGPVLFSPGPLNAEAKAQALGGVSSHSDLAGECGACHPSPWSSQTMADRCLDCHTEVGAQIKAKSGLHGRLLGKLSSSTCRGCHTDHNGRHGALTATDGAGFPHDLTGFSLQGHQRTANGAKFTCADCHTKDLTQFDQATCADCHAAIDATFMSEHEAAFGKKCLLCHDGSDRGASVDHSKFAFKLTGKHAGVACEKCHGNAKSLQDFQKTPQDCYACHAKDDKHQGAYGKQCGQCHTPDGWSNATFDHTKFPLDHGSSEQKATCTTCHPTNVSTYTCYGCHRHTTASVRSGHEGRNVAELADCIRCHPDGRAGD